MPEKTLKKNLSWTTAGMVLYNFAIWMLSALTLRMLGARMSGYYAVATSIGNTLYAVALWGMRSFIVSDTRQEYTYAEYCGARLAGIGISAAALAVILLLSGYDSMQIWILLLYSVFKFTETLIELMDCFMQQKKQMAINAKSMILRSVLFIAAFFLALKLTRSLITGLAAIIVLSLAVFLFYNLRLVKQEIPLTAVLFNGHTRAILRQCFPIMAFELLSALVVAIPRLRYEAIGSLDALGIYTSIYTLVIFLQLVINVLIYTFAPYMADSYNSGNTRQFLKYAGVLFLGSAVLALAAEILVKLFGGPVVTMLYGSVASPYYSYLYIGILSGVSLAWTWMFSQLFVILRRTYDQLYCSLAATAACWLLSNQMIQAGDCNTMSTVLILTNLVFILTAAVLLLYRKRKAAL